jgi:serine/threonine protein kinase
MTQAPAGPARCRLLTKDPRKRPDARDALGHPWLKVTSSKSEQGDAYMQSVSNEVIQNLRVFAASNKLQRVFMHLAVGFMHKGEMEKMLSMFNSLNTDRTKPMPASEITALLCKGRRDEEAATIQKTVEARHPL